MTTAVLPSGVHSFMVHHPFDQMPDTISTISDPWRRHHIHDQMTLNHWQQGHNLPMASVHEPDFRMFHGDYEDTIHNARKQKVRCDLCTEEKTFSRADALTRHYRVCHPDVEFPGKHRRRGGVGV